MKYLRRGFPARVFASSIVLAIVSSDPAEAQTSSARRGDTVHRDAVSAFDRGVKAARTQDWKAARDHFLAAWKLEKSYQIAANLGWAELKMGDHRGAAEHLTYLFRHAPPKALSPAERDRLQAMLAQARSRIGAVTIHVDTLAAEVLVNGEPVGLSPLLDPVFVAPGRIVVEARRAGYSPAKTFQELTAGSSSTVELRLLPQSKATGSFSAPTPPPARTDRWRTVMIGAGIGLSTAAVVAGTATALVSADRAEKSEDLRITHQCEAECMDKPGPWRDAHNSMRRASASFTNASIWSFVGAGVVGAGTAVYAVTTAHHKRPSQGGTALRVSVYGTGLLVTGNW